MESPSSWRRFFSELKRRKVYRVAVAYVAVAFVGLQAVDLLVPATTLPPWADELLIALSVFGFPIALVLAWAFEVSPEGVRRARPVQERGGLTSDGGEALSSPRRSVLAGSVFVVALVLGAYLVTTTYGTENEEVPEIRSLAVLPLQNLSGDPEQEYFTDGMTEALIAELAQIEALQVKSRTSAMHYEGSKKRLPEIANELDVQGVVEGSVLRAGDEVRITLQLVHGPTDRHLWTSSYERELRDVLALQSEVARAIAEEIEVQLTPEEEARLAVKRSVDPEAYRQYLMGNVQLLKLTEPGYRRAIEHYQDAIAIDQSYAPAYAGLAMTYIEMSWWLSFPPGSLDTEARAAALQALERDSTLAEAHIALGRIKQLFEWDWPGAEVAFRRGIELNPSATPARLLYHNYLIAMGRFDEAVTVARRAIEHDPLSPNGYNALGFALMHLGRNAEAQEQIQKSVELAPGHGARRILLAESYVLAGQLEEALKHASRADSLLGGAKLPTHVLRLGFVYAKAHRRAEALRILNQLRDRGQNGHVPPTALALIHLALDEKERALELLEQAYEQRDVLLVFLKGYYMFDPLRDDPRFQDLLRRMNFPEP